MITMTKAALGLGILVSIIVLTILIVLAFALQANTGELHASSFALLGWVSGMVGLFVAASSD